MSTWKCSLLLLLMKPYYSSGLRAYDCAKDKTKYSEISLKEIGPCSEVGKNYKDPATTYVQVIKKIRSNNFKSKYCKVKINLDIMACGWDGLYSYTYQGKILSTNEVISIPKENCEVAHRTRNLAVNIGDNNIVNIPFEHTNYVANTIEVKGSLTHQSSCLGETFKFKGIQYQSSILKLSYEAEIREINSIYNADEDMVIIPDKVKSPAKPLYISDREHGTFTWNSEDLTREVQCDDYQEVISGQAQVYYPADNKTNYEPLVLFEDNSRGRQAALMKGDATGACGRVVFKTQLKDILVLFPSNPEGKLPVEEINDLNTDKFMNLEGKISQTHLSSEIRTNEAFAKITGSICESNRLRLQESINNFASSGVGLSNQPEGTITIRAGSTAYLFQCAPVEVELRLDDQKFCTHEVPIWVNTPSGRIPKFADPVSMVILTNASLTICTSVTPIKWALPHPSGIGHEWFCSTPMVTKCTAPSILDPMLIKNSVFNVESQALRMSFYDRTHLENLAKFQSMGNVRDAITTKITHDMLSDKIASSTGYNIMNGIPEQEFEKLKEKLTPWIVRSLGEFWNLCGHFMIAYFAFNFLVWLVTTTARLRKMAMIHGILSPKILYAFVTELFLASVNQVNIRSYAGCPFAQMSITEVRKLLAEPPSYREETDLTAQNESPSNPLLDNREP